MSWWKRWEFYVVGVQRIYVARFITILDLTPGDMLRPDRQLLVTGKYEEEAARLLPSALIAAPVIELNDTGRVAKCMGPIELLHGLKMDHPPELAHGDLTQLLIIASP
jgi:hypothetical protein